MSLLKLPSQKILAQYLQCCEKCVEKSFTHSTEDDNINSALTDVWRCSVANLNFPVSASVWIQGIVIEVVTLWYRAPEVLLTGQYATAVDMWSCGCIFAELFLRRPLFKGGSEGDQLKKIFEVIGRPDHTEWPEDGVLLWTSFKPTLPPPIDTFVPEIDNLAKDLLEKMLIFNPHRRISAKNALNHAYFRDDLDSIRTSSSLSASENDSFSDSRSDTPVSK